VVIPLASFWQPASPTHHSIVYGLQPPFTQSQVAAFFAGGSSRCTSIGSQPALGSYVLTPSTYADLNGLYAAFLNGVQTSGNLTFASGLGAVADAEITRIIGGWRLGSIVTSIATQAALLGGLTSVAVTTGGDLDQLALYCNIPRVTGATFTQYTVPVSVIQRSTSFGGNDNVLVSTQNQTTTVYTYGSVQVSGTSANALRASLQDVSDTSVGCPVGRKRRLFTIREDFVNAFDTSLVVGVRNASMVQLPAGTNCFGTYVVAVTPPTSCPGQVCTTMVQFSTRCALLPVDGNGLNLCVYQSPASKLADLGSSTGVYPSNLNYQQSFVQFPTLWQPGVAGGDRPAGQDATGASPDQISVTLNSPVYLETQSNATFAIRAGLLPTPDGNLSQALVLYDTGVNATTTTTDLRNLQLTNQKTLTPVVWLLTREMRQTFLLTIDLATLVIRPLNPLGLVLSGLAPLSWSDIRLFVTNSPRGQVCPTCVLLRTVGSNAQIGLDGFAIPVAVLRRLLPANGYRLEFSYAITLPPIGGTLAGQTRSGLLTGSNRRRLLQQSDENSDQDETTVSVGHTSLSFLVDNSTVFDPTLGWDIGPTSPSVERTLGSLIGISAAVGTVGIALGWLAPLFVVA
jgi:hypothetical protein